MAFLLLLVPSTAEAWTICAIGDSHVEPNSAFVRALQSELGPEYTVRAEGRRGWSTVNWLRAGDFGQRCQNADVVLVSLGGNDISQGRSWASIYQNVKQLMDQIPWGRVRLIYHMVVPRFFYPLPTMASDGIHLAPQGSREYARVVAPFLQIRRDLQR